jgi:putative transposase
MLSVKALVDGLGVFEGNKVPLELKVLGLAFYIQLSSLRRAARILSEVRSVSKTAVWKWVKKFGEKVSVKPSRMPGRLIALDETCVKVNGLEYWVYAAVDVDGNEVLSMKVYPSRNMLATKLSHKRRPKVLRWKALFRRRWGTMDVRSVKESRPTIRC